MDGSHGKRLYLDYAVVNRDFSAAQGRYVAPKVKFGVELGLVFLAVKGRQEA